jgi:hypothetical protein
MLLRTLLHLLLRVLPVCGLLCVAVPAVVGREIAASEAWDRFGFSYCDLPCFAGVIPGLTPQSDTPHLIFRHVPAVDYRTFASGVGFNFWGSIQSQRLAGFVRSDPQIVEEVRLNVLIPVENLIAQLGTPDCILPNSIGDPQRVTVIFWIRDEISIGAVLGVDQRVVDLRADTLALWVRAVAPDDCSLRGALPWRGFAPFWTYGR